MTILTRNLRASRLVADHAVIRLVDAIVAERLLQRDDISEKRRKYLERCVGGLMPLRLGQGEQAFENHPRECVTAGGRADVSA